MGPENPRALSISGLLPLVQTGGLLDNEKGNFVTYSYNQYSRQPSSTNTGTSFVYTTGQQYAYTTWSTYCPGTEPPSQRSTTGSGATAINHWWLITPGLYITKDTLVVLENYCRINQASTSTQRFYFDFGFDNVITGTRHNELHLVYRDDINSGNWYAWGTETDIALGNVTTPYATSNIPPIIGQFCKFKLVMYNNIVSFYVNDIFILSMPWTPTFPSQPYLVGSTVRFDKVSGTGAVTMDLMWMRMLQIYNYTQNYDY